LAVEPSVEPTAEPPASPPGKMSVQRHVLRQGRRIGIAIAGGAVMLVGLVLAMPLVPGPGAAVMLLGLAILSLEFERPRRWMARLKAKGVELKQRLSNKPAPPGDRP
jgi:hypothetical protein